MSDNINVGELDEIIEIQQCLINRGAKGQKSYEYKHHSDVWAKVLRNVDEMVSNGNLLASTTLEVVCYKISGLSASWRVVIDGTAYAITGIDPISRISPLNRLTLQILG